MSDGLAKIIFPFYRHEPGEPVPDVSVRPVYPVSDREVAVVARYPGGMGRAGGYMVGGCTGG